MSDKYPAIPILNIQHLKPYVEDETPEASERAKLPETRGDKIESEEYEVEEVVEHKWDKRKRQRVYKVRWKGFGPFYDTWQTERDLKNAAKALREYKTSKGL
ncbi:hypothetical protein GGF50DRAFT_122060 [Schizophyllum commune]